MQAVRKVAELKSEARARKAAQHDTRRARVSVQGDSKVPEIQGYLPHLE
jgi:hypothetical protein